MMPTDDSKNSLAEPDPDPPAKYCEECGVRLNRYNARKLKRFCHRHQYLDRENWVIGQMHRRESELDQCTETKPTTTEDDGDGPRKRKKN